MEQSLKLNTMKKVILTAMFALMATLTLFAQEQQRPQRGERPTSAKVIERLDINKDGVISKNESQGPLTNNFDRVDVNADGLVTAEELEKGFKKREGRLGKKGYKGSRRVCNSKGMFEKVDQNHDGYISKSEAQGSLEEHFTKVDVNGDGLVSRKEAEMSIGKHEGRRPAPNQVLGKLDTNKDGFITKSEAQGPLENHFDKVDANQDGKISKAELEKAR